MAGGTVLGVIFYQVKPITVAASVIAGTGGSEYLISHYGKVKFKKFKSGAVIKHVSYFKWTNPEKFEYKVKIRSWVEYKRKEFQKLKHLTIVKVYKKGTYIT